MSDLKSDLFQGPFRGEMGDTRHETIPTSSQLKFARFPFPQMQIEKDSRDERTIHRLLTKEESVLLTPEKFRFCGLGVTEWVLSKDKLIKN